MSRFDICLRGNIFVIVIVFSFVIILVHENKAFLRRNLFHDDSPFCSEVICFERNLGLSHFHCDINHLE